MGPKVGVSVILIDKNKKVLVGKRKGSHGAGLLSVPGGHIEFNESFVTTCYRELNEEIGVSSLVNFKPCGFSQDFFKHDGIIKHYITLYFFIDEVDSEVLEIKNMEPDKCEGWDWVSYEDLPEIMFCDTRQKIKELLNK